MRFKLYILRIWNQFVAANICLCYLRACSSACTSTELIKLGVGLRGLNYIREIRTQSNSYNGAFCVNVYQLFSQKAPSQMFDSKLNTPLQNLLRPCSHYTVQLFTPFYNHIRYNVNKCFFAVVVSVILKIFNVTHVLDKSK